MVIATFVYDGDGKRVKSIMGSETILFVSGHYEVTNPGSGQTVSKYYFAGASRIAMRKYTIPQNMTVEYMLGDHLGSTSITTDSSGNKVSEMRYKAWGEVRYSWTSGTSTTPAYKLSSYTFTGQYSYMDDPSTSGVTEGFGLMFYNARMYDPALGRFAQADSITPGGVQGLDRYAYVNNSPVRYTDPTGHRCANRDEDIWGSCKFKPPTIPEPSKDCVDDCYDAYLTYNWVAYKLGHVPTMEEILYMTASAEYAPRADDLGVRAFGREGLARNYYSQCGQDGCQGDELYNFLSGYEPWSDRSGVVNNKESPAKRAADLMGTLNSSDKPWLWDDVNNKILNRDFASSQGWTYGKIPDKPWQWFGPMAIRPNSGIKVCYASNCDVALMVDLGNGNYFVMVTAFQDSVFEPGDWK